MKQRIGCSLFENMNKVLLMCSWQGGCVGLVAEGGRSYLRTRFYLILPYNKLHSCFTDSITLLSYRNSADVGSPASVERGKC